MNNTNTEEKLEGKNVFVLGSKPELDKFVGRFKDTPVLVIDNEDHENAVQQLRVVARLVGLRAATGRNHSQFMVILKDADDLLGTCLNDGDHEATGAFGTILRMGSKAGVTTMIMASKTDGKVFPGEVQKHMDEAILLDEDKTEVVQHPEPYFYMFKRR